MSRIAVITSSSTKQNNHLPISSPKIPVVTTSTANMPPKSSPSSVDIYNTVLQLEKVRFVTITTLL